MPTSLANDGGLQPTQRARGKDTAASDNAQRGSTTSECVMLRCHSMMASGFRAIGPANTSMSGKIAPSVHAAIAARATGAVVERCHLLSAEPAGTSSLAKKAFPASAPTIPCVIVSMKLRSYSRIERLKNSVTSTAPEFSADSTDGKKLTLPALKYEHL